MKTSLLTHFACLLTVCAVMFTPSAVHAQESTPEAEATESNPIYQGRAAVLLANSLGFYVAQNALLTPQKAVAVLMQNGISPPGGWEINTFMTIEVFARLVGQALELDRDFTDEQKADPTAQAYKDILVEEYDFDFTLVVTDGIRVTSGPNPNDGEPITGQPVPSDMDLLVSVDDVNQVLATIPNEGGDSGQVDDDIDDMTPSAP